MGRALFGRLSVLFVCGAAFLAPGGCSDRAPAPQEVATPPAPAAYFTTEPEDPLATPKVVPLRLPDLPNASAIWGSTGRDQRGHVWFGVCERPASGQPSAHLVEFVPETGETVDRGDVVSELQRAGAHHPGEQQAKIHTQIVQAADGYLYFASMDEEGGDYESGTRNPTWGSHLWRLLPPETEWDDGWEHLGSTPDGLIALSGTGRYVYALGYFGHTLYQYDTRTGRTRSVDVGSSDGHISRNFATDWREHAYVPRVVGGMAATLVEYDAALNEVAQTPLEHYIDRTPAFSHGMTAIQPLADGSVVFATCQGYLYRIFPPAGTGPATVVGLGWLHPAGARYVASLFTYGGRRYVMGLATEGKDTDAGAHDHFDWVFYDLEARQGVPVPFVASGYDEPSLRSALLYGSVTRDNAGRFYVVGTRGGRPLALQVTCP